MSARIDIRKHTFRHPLEEFVYHGELVCLDLEIDADFHEYPGDSVTPGDNEIEWCDAVATRIDGRTPTRDEVEEIKAMLATRDWSEDGLV